MRTKNAQNRIHTKTDYGFVMFLSLFVSLILWSNNCPLAAETKTSFIQITDTHISGNTDTHIKLQQVLEDITKLPQKPAFIINTGDITEFGSEVEFKHYKAIIDTSGFAVYNALGNHDVRWSNTGKKRFAKWLGLPYQSFNAAGVHFILLDSGLLLEQYGHFSQQQLDWLKQNLETVGTEKPIIIAAHHPLFLEKKYVDNEFDLLKLLEGYNIILYLCGHGHRDAHWHFNGIHFIMTQAAKSETPGYRLYEIDKDSIQVFSRNLNENITAFNFSCGLNKSTNAPQFTIHEPKTGTFFDENLPVKIASKNVSKIEASLDGENWICLEYSDGKFSRNIKTNFLCEGFHTLKLRLVASDGKLWLDRLPIRIDHGRVKIISKFQTNDAIIAPLAIANNTIFIGSLDNYLYALDAENMGLKWSFQTNGPIVTASTFQKNTIFVTSGDGYCYALNRENGRQIWKMKIAESIFSSPVYSEGKLIFGASDSTLHALKSSDGKLLWTFQTNDHIKARPAVSNDKVFVGSWDRYIYCISKNSGDLIWRKKISDNRYFPAATSNPLIHNETVIVTSHDHVVHAFQSDNGILLWNHPAKKWNKPGYSSPKTNEKMIYFGSLSGHLFALDAQSGEDIWTTALPDSINPDPIFDSSPAIANSQVVVGSIGGTVYVVDKNSGKLEWSLKLSDGYIFSSPIVWKNYVFIGSCDGAIYKIKLPE